MPNATNDPLFLLIKTLTKAEKRIFRLYVTRNQNSEELKFIHLFDAMDKQHDYDEPGIFKKVPDIKKEQLSNLKAHLYKQLLTSLRMIEKNKNTDIDIRENIDYAKVLYNKGLYPSALKILERAKNLANTHHLYLLVLETLEFEKMIEIRHITKAHEGRADVLAQETQKLMVHIQSTARLSNLSIQLYSTYLKLGHAKNPEEFQKINLLLQEELKNLSPIADMNFFECVYLYQCHTWVSYIGQNWKNYFRYTYKWVEMFEREPLMKINDTALYFKGLHNLLNALFMTLDHARLSKILANTEIYVSKHEEVMHESSKITAQHLIHTAHINKHFLEGSFTEGLKRIPLIEKFITDHAAMLDEHRILVFYYKIACLYFGVNNYDKCILYLNKIINLKTSSLRTDIQCFSRMLHLIAHYEKGHHALLEYYTKSVYRFLLKHGDMSGVVQEVLRFLRKALFVNQKELKDVFAELKNRLEILAENPYERRSFIYLDIIAWLESKTTTKSIEAISKKKFLGRELRSIRMASIK